MAISVQSNGAFWLPAECIVRSRNGRAYPSVMREGKGCRLTDMEGNSWIDMAMTGGFALLGYAHPAVQTAIAADLASSAILTLPHILELEVSALLRKLFPDGEMVVFGKDGSDVCTVACERRGCILGGGRSSTAATTGGMIGLSRKGERRFIDLGRTIWKA